MAGWILFLVDFILIGLNFVAKANPEMVEKIYARGIYRYLSQGISQMTNLVPFSVAEFLIYALVLGLIFLILRLGYTLFKNRQRFLRRLMGLVLYLLTIYSTFLLMWGYNYNRVSFAQTIGLPQEKHSVEELAAFHKETVTQLNRLRPLVAEDAAGVMCLDGSPQALYSGLLSTYKEAAKTYPTLGGSYGSAKGILISPLMNYTNITGIYIPFTAEANVNTAIMDYELPFTAAHEMAHQRGYTNEDEANFIAFLVCINSSNADIQYSGWMMANIYSGNQLYRYDQATWNTLYGECLDSVIRDKVAGSTFWEQYQGKAEEIATSVNNTYLKANGQSDGVYSYNRVVDLMLDLYSKEGIAE